MSDRQQDRCGDETVAGASAASVATTSGGGRDRGRLSAVLPGLLLAVLVAAAAEVIARAVPGPVSAVPVAVLLGLAIGGAAGPRIDAGVAFATKRVLQAGIVLLGARLSLGDVVSLGIGSVGLVVITISCGFTVAWLLGRRAGVTRELAALLGVGSAICGNTAILATAPIIRARSRDVGLAVAAITLCGTAALLVYPPLGRALGLSDASFGVWVGLAVQDTSQVVATGAAYSEAARDIATVVKLVRNTALAAVLPLIAWAWQRHGPTASKVSVRRAFPLFVLWFLLVAAARSVGLFGDAVAARLGDLAGWAILVAVAGLGLSVRFADLRRAGGRAIGIGVVTALVLGGIGLLAGVLLGDRLG